MHQGWQATSAAGMHQGLAGKEYSSAAHGN